MNTKILAMYLPQYHEIPENNQWWGKGFTDWVSAKSAEVLYPGHIQPRVPLNDNYYDLSRVEDIRWQVALAKAHNVYGFGIYHYWFSSQLSVMKTPAELLLANKDIDMPFFFAWDNCSWVRTWSKFKHNTNAWSPKYDQGQNGPEILAELVYGDESDWKIHYDYLKQFFQDPRYIKIDNKPMFIFWNYNNKEVMAKMFAYWNKLAQADGFDGVYIISRVNPYDSMGGLDGLFNYEPMFTAWQNKNLATRVWYKVVEKFRKKEKLTIYSYDTVWKSILRFAEHCKDPKVMFGGFVDYDDSPRRGKRGKIVIGGTPEKFKKYLSALLKISNSKQKEYVFLTAWNEWGEGAYLEPDTRFGTGYLEALKEASEKVNG